MKLNKAFKLGLWVLMIVSIAILVWGFSVGFETNDGLATDVLLTWAYIMVGIAVFCWVILGLIVSARINPKSLIKLGGILVGAAVLCLISYLIAPGSPAMGMAVQPSATTLKLTDALLNLTYICGGGAIIAIIVGEIRMSVASKK